MFFKIDFWDEYRELNVTRVPEGNSSESRKVSPRIVKTKSCLEGPSNINVSEFVLKPAYKKKIPITTAKYKDLQDLCVSRVIPEEYHGFYSSLAHTTARGTAEDDDELVLTLMRSTTKNKKRKANQIK